ncbi:MAG: hypothetical protein D3923_10485, partial [Candidatus Electrothrix sp. AR3]|nr:hypothetical protein [Candidatus Electrothrix sp. AR3]
SLNKTATTDILKNLQEDSEQNEYFHILVMRMLDSEEYGIKDSDLGHWTRVCVEYIVTVDRFNERSGRGSKHRGIELIQQYFRSEDRKGKIQATRDALNELFDQYFQSIQDGEYYIQEGRCLESILYFISSLPVLANPFQEKIEKALSIFLNRKRYGLQFLAAMELFSSQLKIIESISDAYTIDEAMLCKDLFGKSLVQRLTLEKESKHWLDVLLRWGMLLENLSIFSVLERCSIFADISKTLQYRESAIQFQALYNAKKMFWQDNWYTNTWRMHAIDRLSMNEIFPARFFGAQTYSSVTVKHRSISFNISMIFEKSIHKALENSIRNIAAKLKRKEESSRWSVLAMLYSANTFLYSDIEHDQDGNRYDYLWTTYEELEHIYILLQNPEALYAHLEKNTTSLIDKATFLEQYKKYDQKPYSMRHMAKTVLDRGKENYPDSDNDKIMKKCQELVERVAQQVEQEQKASKNGHGEKQLPKEP